MGRAKLAAAEIFCSTYIFYIDRCAYYVAFRNPDVGLDVAVHII